MPIFARKSTNRKSLSSTEPTWEDYQHRMSAPSTSQDPSQGSSSTRPPPRGILRNSIAAQAEDPAPRPTMRASVPNLRDSRGSTPQQEGRDRFASLPNTASSPSFDVGGKQSRHYHDVRASPSLSQLNARARAHLQAAPRVSDAEADRIARACGDGPFSPSVPTTPLLDVDPYVSYTPQSRPRSQTINVGSLLHTPPQALRPSQSVSVQPFPYPTREQAVRALKHVLKKDTKDWDIRDYLEIEEYLSGHMFESEETLIIDFIRDRENEEDGEDAIWRLQRKERKLMDKVNREIRKRDGNVFGSYLQDIADSALTPVVVGGYKHFIPSVMDACVEELYRTGIYQQDLFRALPNRSRLLNLVTYFDIPFSQSRPSSPRSSISGPSPRYTLNQESTQDICALLVTYLNSLPTPMMHRNIADAFWSWCVFPSVLRAEGRIRRRGDDEASESEDEDPGYDEDTDDNGVSHSARRREQEQTIRDLPPLRVQVKIAQHVLLLLPRRHFSLLVHLFAFFATLQVCPDNGLTPEDLGRIFGAAIAGGPKGPATTALSGSSNRPERSARDKEDRGQKIVAWMVKHWEQIAVEYENEESHSQQEQVRGRTRVRSHSTASETQRRERSLSRPSERRQSFSTHKSVGLGLQIPEALGKCRLSVSERGSASSRSTSVTESDKDEGRALSPLMEYPTGSPVPKPKDLVRIRGDSDAAHGRAGYDSPPRVDLPSPFPNEKLFSVAPPFNVPLDADDDASIYSTDEPCVYANSLLQEPLPSVDTAQTLEIRDSRSSLATILSDPPRPKRQPQPMVPADDSAASRYVLERENAELKKRLEELMDERDEARKVVDTMKGLVGVSK